MPEVYYRRIFPPRRESTPISTQPFTSKLFRLSGLALLTLGLVSCGGKNANSPTITVAPRYFCGQDAEGTYTTYAETPKGKQAIIRWKSEYFSKSNWTPEARCQEVSPKFDQAAMNNQLNYITNDTQNNLPVVCAAIDESEGRRIPEYASPCTPWAKNIGQKTQRI